MLRSRASSRFAPLRSTRTLSVAGSVAAGAGGAACLALPTRRAIRCHVDVLCHAILL